MVAFTANRGYPYSTNADPADIPAAIESLARAGDTDMQALSDSIIQRPMARVSAQSTTPQIFPSTTDTLAEFDFVDVDNASISNLTAFNTRLTPTSAGFWAAYAFIDTPAGDADLMSFGLRVNGTLIARQGNHESGASTVTVTRLNVAGGSFMDGVDDYFSVTLNPAGSSTDVKVFQRGLACFRLTNI